MAMSERKYVSFDIEVAVVVAKGDDWSRHRPYGITCAALSWPGEGTVHAAEGSRMDRRELVALARQLLVLSREYVVVTHNGLGFDFDVLAEELTLASEGELAREVVALAYSDQHVDTCLAVQCIRGFPVSLAKIAEALGLPGKSAGMTGADAPLMWAAGPHERAEVLAYVAQDAEVQRAVAVEVERRGSFSWITKAGGRSTFDMEQWPTVVESLAMPLPDTSWMRDPIPRSRFSRWLSRYGVEVQGP